MIKTTKMSVAKQLAMNFHVNNVPMPLDILNNIKDFAFTKTEEFIKNKKRELKRTFDEAIHSRKNTSCWVTDRSEIWIFCIYDENMNCFKLEGGNCSDCGQYFMNSNPNLLCNCFRENPMIMPDDQDWDQQEEDFDDDPGADYP